MTSFAYIPILVAVSLFLGMLLFQEIGRRIGICQIAKNPEERNLESSGTTEAAIFALFGLLVAFTFSGAASRFDDQRHLIAEETNAIGTAYLRLDLVSADARSALQGLFNQYLDARLEFYKKLPDTESAQVEWNKSMSLQNAIWTRAVEACQAQANPSVCVVLLPALNEMIDITTTRKMSTLMHPPIIIFILLFVFAIGCSFVGGCGMARSNQRRWVHNSVFAAMVAITVYVIIDIEYPRSGIIRVDTADQVLIELRSSMN